MMKYYAFGFIQLKNQGGGGAYKSVKQKTDIEKLAIQPYCYTISVIRTYLNVACAFY